MGSSQNSKNVAESEGGKVSDLVNISVLKQLVKNIVKSELTDSLDDLVKKAVSETCSANGIDLSAILETKPSETMAPNSSKTSLKVEIKAKSEIGSTSNGVMPGDVAKNCCSPSSPDNKSMKNDNTSINFSRRRFVIVREYPPFCGRNAPCPTKEERGEILKKRNFEELSKPLKKTARTDMRTDPVRERERVKGSAVGDEILKRKNFGDSTMAFKEIARADLNNNPVRQRANVATKNNSNSHGNSSNSNKSSQNVNMFSKMRDEVKESSTRAFKETARTDLNNNSVRERASVDTKNNSVSHGNPSNSNKGAQNVNMSSKMRNKVKETLVLFRTICEELIQQEKALRRVDLKAARMVRERGKEVNTEIQRIGPVPGVEVGDEFLYRVELVIVGVHRLHQAGIDYMKRGSIIIATSIIASEGYLDDMANADILIYSGHGGNINGRKNEGPEDQKLEKGNLALKNSISAKTPVRVTRGFLKETCSNRARVVTYTYDGLYTVEKYWSEMGLHGKIVYKFELRRNTGQPRVAWKRNVVKIQKR